MLVGEIMTSPVVTVREDATPDAAVRLLSKHQVTLLPVLDVDDRLVGVVSEADLLGLPELQDPRAHLRPPSRSDAPPPLTLAALMVRSPVTTTEQADVAELASLFHETSWKCLPVMRGNKLVGVVSRSDIVRALSRDDDDIEADVNRVLSELGDRWQATVANGIVTVAGAGSERERDGAASLAATVAGVRGIEVVEPRRERSDKQPGAGPLPTSWPSTGYSAPVSSGSATDQL